MSVTMSVILSHAALGDIKGLPRVDPGQVKDMVSRYLANHDPFNSGKPSGRRGGSVVIVCLWANCYVLLEVVAKAKKKFEIYVEGVAKREAQLKTIARRRL